MSLVLADPRNAEAEGEDTASKCAASWRYVDLDANKSAMAIVVNTKSRVKKFNVESHPAN
jgi:hypothetical protein